MKTNKIKNVLKEISFWTMAILIPAGLLAQVCWATANLVAYPVDYEVVESITVPRADKEEINIREYVLNEVEKAGLSRREANAIIECESNWNTDAHKVNWDNKKGVDRGLWQISSLFHKEVSNKCAYDFRCSTKEAIRINKEWGNSWCAWSCGKKLGFCK